MDGDIFARENGETHRFTAEAVVKTTVRVMRRASLEVAADIDIVVWRNLLGLTTDNLQHAKNHMLLLGRKSLT
ncbi:hypothetical protein ACNJX9_36080 [Bradyrhizobium sp. DASA03076]|uniref:hypothetical protein n=1 Tax=Bradyrhizobium sp. BLXBL-03 TaxID=3395916 RepID=UPI003F721265